MKRRCIKALLPLACSGLALSVSQQACAQTATKEATPPASGAPQVAESEIRDIIVTAQKRSERLQDVPMSITAASAGQLKALGITSPEQLEKAVAGFTVDKTFYGLPVFFIRGVGFNDTSLGVSPAVSVYMDQLPIPFSAMARGVTLDLERAEVLKGPQGTLFGQNSTGGAVNFIAAKPTDKLAAGFDLTFGRFNQIDAEAFISGPISETLSARLAVRNEYRGDWQKGYTVSQSLGKKDFHNGRLTVDWKPVDRVKVELSASGWQDKSDAQQPQFVKFDPAETNPLLANPLLYPVASVPAAPNNARAAAWDINRDFATDNWFYQFGGRVDVEVSDTITLTSLTSYSKYGQNSKTDFDATIYPIALTTQIGKIHSFSQEIRLSGSASDNRIKWMVGGNYQKDRTFEQQINKPFGFTKNKIGPIVFDGIHVDNLQKVDTKAIFGSLDFKLTDTLTAQGSVRYTKQNRDFNGCLGDASNGQFAAAWGLVSFLFTGVPHTFAPTDCVTLSARGVPLQALKAKLDEDNVSWRAGLNWKPNTDALVYANITKGYKSGSFPTIAYGFERQAQPVSQESVLAYEVGAKINAFSQKLQVSGAGFYYDYRHKQLSAFVLLPPFGPAPGLVSFPKTTVKGAEISVTARPVAGLTLAGNGTYLDTRIDKNPTDSFGPLGNPANFVGHSFANTPKWQGTVDTQYRFPVSGSLDAYLGANLIWHSATDAVLVSGDPSVAAQEALLRIPSYALLDLRAGLEAGNGSWKVEAWGRNVTNKFYVTGANRYADYFARYAGMPVTYGFTLSYRY